MSHLSEDWRLIARTLARGYQDVAENLLLLADGKAVSHSKREKKEKKEGPKKKLSAYNLYMKEKMHKLREQGAGKDESGKIKQKDLMRLATESWKVDFLNFSVLSLCEDSL